MAKHIAKHSFKWGIIFVAILLLFTTVFLFSLSSKTAFAEEEKIFTSASDETPIILVSDKNQEYNREPLFPTISGILGGQPFTDFEVSYTLNGEEVDSPFDCGEYLVTVLHSATKEVLKTDTFTITPKLIPVTLTDAQLNYDGLPKSRGINYSTDLLPPEEGKVIALYRQDGSPQSEGKTSVINAGMYQIELLIDNPNYDLGSVSGGGWMEILKRQLTIGFEDITVLEGEEVEFTFRYIGFAEGEGVEVLNTLPKMENIPKSYGEYLLRPSGASALNYNIVYAENRLTINRANINANINDDFGINLKGNFKHHTNISFAEVAKKDISADIISTLKNSKQIISSSDIEKVYSLDFSSGGIYPSEHFQITLKGIKLSGLFRHSIGVIDENGNLYKIDKFVYKDGNLIFNVYSDGTLVVYRKSLTTYIILGSILLIIGLIVTFKISSHLSYKRQKNRKAETENQEQNKKKELTW